MINEVRHQLTNIIGTQCWDVSNIVTGTLQLNFGGAVLTPTKGKIKKPWYIAQYDILVWGVWRIDDENDSLCSSDDNNEKIVETSIQLVGDTVQNIEIVPPVWDTQVTFLSGKTLKIFCLYTSNSESTTNWDLGIMDTYYFMGKGSGIEKSIKRCIIPDSIIDAKTLPPVDLKKRIEIIQHCPLPILPEHF